MIMSVVAIVAFILLIIFFIWYINAQKIADKPGFSVVMLTIFSLIALILLALFIAYLLSTKDSEKKGMDWHYNKINEELQKMPNAAEFTWQRGSQTRIDTRKFDDGKEYMTVAGPTKFGNRQLVIYCMEAGEQVIKKFIGDIPPHLEEDMFKGFKPTHKDKFMMFQEMQKSQGLKIKPNVLVNPETGEQQIKEGEKASSPPPEKK